MTGSEGESVDVREATAALVADRLSSASSELHEQFTKSRPVTRYAVLDDVLPIDMARAVYDAFPPDGRMRLESSMRERKFTSKDIGDTNRPLGAIASALQDPLVIRQVEAITGMTDLVGDPLLYAGGVSAMGPGHFLRPHVDNSHDVDRRLYRRINLLYYVTPDWDDANGGQLELWDPRVTSATAISTRFNRLVIMETTRTSFHSVRTIERTDARRCTVSSYLFSAVSPDGTDYFHVTGYSAPPEERLQRMVLATDRLARQAIRKVKPSGLGRPELNRPEN
jgi:Rps23 Pro-64 3,4-dihydroxylase Tpa1-like proline 4-hydroxylase